MKPSHEISDDDYEDILDALYAAIPFLEDALDDDGYKPGAVAKNIRKIKDAIAKLEASKCPT